MKTLIMKNAVGQVKEVPCNREDLTEALHQAFTNVSFCTIRGMMPELSFAALNLSKIAIELDALNEADAGNVLAAHCAEDGK